MATMRHQITGDWRRVDSSQHTLEVVQTATPGLIALRSTEDPSTVIYGTKQQFHDAGIAVEQF
jgi:hypothetical protein